MIAYQLVRSKRKTLAIHILKDATVEVRAPMRLSQKEIETFLLQKEDWILKKQAYMQTYQPQTKKETIQQGDLFWFQGKEYPVEFGNKLQLTENYFIMPESNWHDIKPKVIAYYKKLLLPILLQKIDYYSNRMGVNPTAVKVNSALKRWGSCSAKNALNFSFMLGMVQESELEYVVVHELAHIKQHNHSSAFWREVYAVLPDYKQRQQNLKQMQQKIHTFW